MIHSFRQRRTAKMIYINPAQVKYISSHKPYIDEDNGSEGEEFTRVHFDQDYYVDLEEVASEVAKVMTEE